MIKAPTRKIIFTITFGALLVFGVVLARALYYAPPDEIPASPLTVDTANIITASMVAKVNSPYAFPVHLRIPKIKVDANVQQVGITAKGNMSTPNNFTDVGWYKYGPAPGQVGSAVIAGHVNNGINFPAVFSDLGSLTKGDDIFISDDSGKLLHFKVTGNAIYDYNARVDEVFYQKNGKFLKLITCTGTFIPEFKTHDRRLVVSAILVD